MKYIYAFAVGGLFCAVAQVFIDKTKATAILSKKIIINCIIFRTK